MTISAFALRTTRDWSGLVVPIPTLPVTFNKPKVLEPVRAKEPLTTCRDKISESFDDMSDFKLPVAVCNPKTFVFKTPVAVERFPKDEAVVVEKLASSPKAAASSLSVLSVPGAESTKLAIAVLMLVLISPELKIRPVAVCRAEMSVSFDDISDFRLPVAVCREAISESLEDMSDFRLPVAVCSPMTFVFKTPVEVFREARSVSLEVINPLTVMILESRLPVAVERAPVADCKDETLASRTPVAVCRDEMLALRVPVAVFKTPVAVFKAFISVSLEVINPLTVMILKSRLPVAVDNKPVAVCREAMSASFDDMSDFKLPVAFCNPTLKSPVAV